MWTTRFIMSILRFGIAAVLLLFVDSSDSGQQYNSTTVAKSPFKYINPIVPGDWSNPGVIRVGSDYYSVCSTHPWQPGVPIINS
ncbi:MAG: hypothetical protein ACYTBV_04510, partial [Planctomycetota bacterium]